MPSHAWNSPLLGVPHVVRDDSSLRAADCFLHVPLMSLALCICRRHDQIPAWLLQHCRSATFHGCH